MWARLQTFFRHWLAPGRRSVLDDAALERLTAYVSSSERQHSGEICICVEARLPDSYLLQSHSMPRLIRHRAVAEFARLHVWDTAQNNGVLIYLLLAERAIEIVADRGLNERVPQAVWSGIIATLAESTRGGHFEDGLKAAVDSVSALLMQHFPLQRGERNPNELPDRPVAD